MTPLKHHCWLKRLVKSNVHRKQFGLTMARCACECHHSRGHNINTPFSYQETTSLDTVNCDNTVGETEQMKVGNSFVTGLSLIISPPPLCRLPLTILHFQPPSSISSSTQLISLNLSGKKFFILLHNFARFPQSRLGRMVSRNGYKRTVIPQLATILSIFPITGEVHCRV